MNTKQIALSGLLALAAFSGSAFAGDAMPVSGAGPLFQDQPVVASSLTRAQVQQQAILTPPASGAQSVVVQVPGNSTLSRAQVQNDVRQAMARGYRVPSGAQS